MCPKTLLGKSNQAKIYFFPIKQNVSDTIKRNGTLSGFLRHEEHWKPTTTFLLPVPSVLPSFYLRIFFCFFGQIIIFIFQLKFKSSPLFLLITKHLPMLIWSRLCCGLWGISAKSQDILTLEKENLVNLKNYDVRALSTRVVYLLLNFLNSCVSPSQEGSPFSFPSLKCELRHIRIPVSQTLSQKVGNLVMINFTSSVQSLVF